MQCANEKQGEEQIRAEDGQSAFYKRQNRCAALA
jgi:hypothetical protein